MRKNSRSSISGPIACHLVIVAAISFAACHNTPDGVIPESEMVSLMADMHTAESVVETERRVFASDSMKQLLKQSVLARYGYNVADLDSSLSYYGRNIDVYCKLYDDVIKTIEERIAVAETQGTAENYRQEPSVSELDFAFDGDSVDVWQQPRMIAFSRTAPLRILPFNLSADQYWERGDVYTLRGKMSGSTEAINVSLAVEDRDGSVDHITARSFGNGWKEAVLTTDSAKTARYVYGTLSYPTVTSELRTAAILDSITLYRTRFNPNLTRDPRMRSVKMSR